MTGVDSSRGRTFGNSFFYRERQECMTSCYKYFLYAGMKYLGKIAGFLYHNP